MVCLLKSFGVKLGLTAAFEIAMLCQSFLIHLPLFISCAVCQTWHMSGKAEEAEENKFLEITSPVEQIMGALELRKILSQDSVRARAETSLVLSKNNLEKNNCQSVKTPVILHVCVAMPLKFPPEAFLPTNSALPWKTTSQEQPPATSACPAAQSFILLEPRGPQQVPEGSEKQKLSI